ncbi:MAG: DUF1559 domain-containing protein [Planctomycetales bacterium]|nr:DUF1559 domain-containing protein [Planctomycetales bacterium]
MKPKPRFHMRDLLILVSAVAVFMALFVLWIEPAREEARRNTCQAKLKALGNGINGFEQAFRAYPPAAPSCTTEAWHSTSIANGQVCVGPNWAAQIAGQMEDIPLALAVIRACDRSEVSSVDLKRTHYGPSAPSYMRCPTASVSNAYHESKRTGLRSMAKTNYAATLGADTYLHSIEGNSLVDMRLKTANSSTNEIVHSGGVLTIRMIPNWHDKFEAHRFVARGFWLFAHGRGTKRNEITDGVSHTIMASEVLPFDSSGKKSDDIRGVWLAASMGASTYSHMTTPNSKTPDNVNGCDAAAVGRMSCVEIPPGTAQEGDTFAAARSVHKGGVNALFADGSVSFIGNDIDPNIWRSRATRAGGEE